MSEAANPLVLDTQQYADDIGLAKTFTRAINTGQKFLSGDGPIKQVRRLGAGIAIAAGLTPVAEIGEQNLPAATRRFCEAKQRIELLALHIFALIRGIRFFDETIAQGNIFIAIEHEHVRRQTVATGSARFLIIGLDAARQVDMNHEAHIRLVYAHAESDGRDNDDRLAVLETGLVLLAGSLVHASVIG